MRELEETTKRRFFLVGVEGEHVGHFRVIDQGTLEKVAPKLPVDVGQELELKLGEVGLHDPHAGVGKVENVDVVVGDAARLVGKKVTARVTAISDGLAWAELLAPLEQSDEPLTAEAEAERPTRAKRPAAVARPSEEDLEVEVEDEPAGEPEEDETDDELDAVAEEEEAPAGDALPKKKTRRGSRGGKNRKKKTTAAAAPAVSRPDEAPEGEPVDAVPEPSGPVIHVPGRELGDENGDAPAPVKKKTRRGSRGGKNRRKTSVAGATTAAATEPEAPAVEEAEPSSNGDGDWGYTPMSEWGIDGGSE